MPAQAARRSSCSLYFEPAGFGLAQLLGEVRAALAEFAQRLGAGNFGKLAIESGAFCREGRALAASASAAAFLRASWRSLFSFAVGLALGLRLPGPGFGLGLIRPSTKSI